MKERIGNSLGFMKTTAMGGVLFLMPVVVLGAMLGYVYTIVDTVHEVIGEFIPVSTHLGWLILFVIAILIVVLLCFLCGLLTKRALARKFSQTLEKQLMLVFPKYAVYKDILTGNMGGDENAPSLTPVLVKFSDYERIAFEADRLENGRVVVYLPGAPDAWIGSVILVQPEQVEPLKISFNEAVGVCERLGRESADLPRDINSKDA